MTTLILPYRTDGGHTNRIPASGGGGWWSREVCSHHSVHPGGALITASRAHDNDNKKWSYGCLDGLSIFLPTHPGLLFWRCGKIPTIPKVVVYVQLRFICLALSCNVDQDSC